MGRDTGKVKKISNVKNKLCTQVTHSTRTHTGEQHMKDTSQDVDTHTHRTTCTITVRWVVLSTDFLLGTFFL